MSASRPSSPNLPEDSPRGDAAEVSVKSAPDYIKPTPIIPPEDVEDRREYAIAIGKRLVEDWPDYKLTSVHSAAIMIMPMDSFKDYEYESYRKPWQTLTDLMKPLVCLVKRYLLQKHSIPKSYVRTAKRRLGTRWNVARIASQPIKTTVSSSDADKESLWTWSESRNALWTGPASTVGNPRTSPPGAMGKGESPGTESHASNKQERGADKATPRMTQSCNPKHIRDPDASRFLTAQSGRARDGELQKELCRQRDHNRCVFTQSAKDVVVTHIIPQAWNDTKEIMHIDSCVEDEANCIIIIQLNWLYRNKNKSKEVTLEGDGNDFDKLVNEIRDFDDQHQIEQKISATANPLISGQLACIKMSKKDARKCRVMLDVAWALSVVAGISGAAE
ncbi:hypothetical protein ACHAPD_005671 [Fusarium lateritium]